MTRNCSAFTVSFPTMHEPQPSRFQDSKLSDRVDCCRSPRQRTQECSAIRSEIVRQQGIGAAVASTATNTMMLIAIRTKTQQIVADLESRAANIECNAAFSNVAPPSPPAERPSSDDKRPTFEECFAKCQQFTARTKERCFDACIGFGSTGKEARSATAKAPAHNEFAGVIFSKQDGHLVVEKIGPRSEVLELQSSFHRAPALRSLLYSGGRARPQVATIPSMTLESVPPSERVHSRSMSLWASVLG